MRAHYAAGRPIEELAQRFGCSRPNVHRWANKLGLVHPASTAARRLSPGQVAQIFALEAAGQSWAAIGAAAGCSATAARAAFQREGGQTSRPAPVTDDEKALLQRQVEAGYRQGVPVPVLSAQLGLTRNQVAGLAYRLGVRHASKKGLAIRAAFHREDLDADEADEPVALGCDLSMLDDARAAAADVLASRAGCLAVVGPVAPVGEGCPVQYCGAARAGGSAYCGDHHARLLLPPPAEEAAA